MQPRMQHPATIVSEAMQALHALGASAEAGGVPPRTIGLVHLRASQLNGDSTCVDSHPRLLRKAGETDERLFALAAWRGAPYFSDVRRAVGGRRAALRRDRARLAARRITTINVWNRLNVATRQAAGVWKP